MAFPNYDSEYFFDHYHLQHHSVVNNVGHFMPQADFYSGWPTDGTYLSTQFMDTSTHWHDFSIKTDHRFAAHWTEPFFNASLPYQHSVFEIPPTDQKIHSCLTCHKQCCRKNLKPFICQACGKKFSQAANLTAHKRVHTGEKPFSCPVCLRPFSQSSSLVTHKRTHTGEKPYPCNQCDKAFTDSSTRTKHLRTHTGQKPYQCHLCLMRFTQSGNLHRHIKTHRDENLCEDNNK